MKSIIIRIAAVLAVLAAGPAALRAQTDATTRPADSSAATAIRPLATGDALRLTAAGQQFTGTLQRITTDTLVLVAPYQIHRLPRALVTAGERAEFTESSGHAILRGVKVGVLGGAAVGLLASVLVTKAAEGRAFIIADGVALGALLGGGLGLRSRRSHWEPVNPALLQSAELSAPASAPTGTQP